MKRIFKGSVFSTIFLACVSTQTWSSDFNLPFINASELGNMYSGWAASANDASTAYSNPAGLVKLNNQQLVVSAVGLHGNTRFNGTQMTPPYPFPPFGPETGSAASKMRGFLPSFYYAVPINSRIVFAIGQTVPFALGTNYPKDSVVRYAATRSQIVVMDFGPSIGFKLSDQIALGLGLDINRMMFKIHNMVGPPISIPDSESQNNLYGWGYGWHGGILYQPRPCTRLGLSFNSMVSYHTSGNSTIFTPFPPSELRLTNQKSNARLPARTQLSIYQDVSQKLALMGTVFYTNWRTLQQITMQNVVFPGGSTATVTIPLEYHNTFDYAVGLNYKPNEKWILRTGLDFLSAPSNNHDRSVADPIGPAVILGLGAHYQQNRCIGYDLGYAHAFFEDTKINVVTPLTTLRGNSTQNANVLGAQVTWNI